MATLCWTALQWPSIVATEVLPPEREASPVYSEVSKQGSSGSCSTTAFWQGHPTALWPVAQCHASEVQWCFCGLQAMGSSDMRGSVSGNCAIWGKLAGQHMIPYWGVFLVGFGFVPTVLKEEQDSLRN